MSPPVADRFCGTKLPWIEHPFRLISWLEMNKFSAESFVQMAFHFGTVGLSLRVKIHVPQNAFPDLIPENIGDWVVRVKNNCERILLTESVKCAERIIWDFQNVGVRSVALSEKIDGLMRLIASEMESQLFLWVPGHRSDWYSKDAEAIVGSECCIRIIDSRIIERH